MEYEPWEIWNGGECPCPDDAIQFQRRDMTRAEAERSAIWHNGNTANWEHEGEDWDIIAFRRVKKPETVTLYGGRGEAGEWIFSFARRYPDRTHRLIFGIVNGEPVNPRFERIE